MTDVTVSSLILQNLVTNFDFTRQSIAYIQTDYFETRVDQSIFECIGEYFRSTGVLPNRNILLVEINEGKLNGPELDEAKEKIQEICQSQPEPDTKWLLAQAETWCQERSMYNAIVRAISIYDGTNKELNPHAIPEMMKEALAVSFQTHIGSDWSEDAEDRFDRYVNKENKIPFDLETLNDITLGGVTKKTLSIILAGVHVGKTMMMCHLAAGYARLGYNVLYFSMEMGEDEIMQRVDANMLKVPMHKIEELGKQSFMKRVHYLRAKNYGKIKVVQFPTSLAHCGHFRSVISELKIKLGFHPDVVMVDYVGIVASNRLKIGSTNSHFYLKSVAEELRAMSIELDVACWSAMQITRCISLTSLVNEKTKGTISANKVIVGDELQSQTGFNKVNRVHQRSQTQVYKITLEDGRSVTCSENHLFPTQNGELKSIKGGLQVGDDLFTLQEFENKRLKQIKSSYTNMMNRCNNPKNNDFKWYGEKGIKVCDRWSIKERVIPGRANTPSQGFQNFFDDLKDGWFLDATIDRIDPHSHYCPENCRWLSGFANKSRSAIISNRERIDRGIHNFQGSSKRKSQLASEYNKRRVQAGQHNFQGERGRNLQRDRVKNGLHSFLQSVTVWDNETFKLVRVPKDQYDSLKGVRYFHMNTKEGRELRVQYENNQH